MKTNLEKRILIIEPSPIVREGFKSLLDEVNGFVLVGSYADTLQLEEHCSVHRPDIIIFNPLLMSHQHRGSIRNFFNIREDLTLVAFVYSFVDELIMQQFDAVLTINDDRTRILNKLQTLQKEHQVEQRTESEDLSSRETEILISIAKGLTNKEIAEKHFISIHTVISHRKNIVRKTGIKTVSGLTMYALLNNLIGYEDIE
jgi:DNA-binding NarL/FixJ family response regulator